jgi:hypothetical protein
MERFFLRPAKVKGQPNRRQAGHEHGVMWRIICD